MKKRIKVVWLCHLSNADIREHLPIRVPLLERLVRRLLNNPCKENTDYAIWNTNGIKEFEKFTNEVELFLVAPFHYLGKEEIRFDMNGIHYFFFKDRPSFLFRGICKHVLNKCRFSYASNTRKIVREIRRIHPDLIHLIGAENPYYGLAALKFPSEIPLIVQLQTMLSDPSFKKSYFMHDGDYDFRCGVEEQLVQRADYIGTKATQYFPFVRNIKKDANIIEINLALSEPTLKKNTETEFDFVYFASSIDKAADLAIEAFAIAHRRHPDLTLDVVGSGSVAFIEQLRRRIEELNLMSAISFEGRLATHAEVISQIRKARFAVLPLKIDLTSSTIREAMANGIPVVTTITPGTPSLNSRRESVLLSKTGDHDALAANMCRLVEDDQLAKRISDNALLTASERQSNEVYMREWKETYNMILTERNRVESQ